MSRKSNRNVINSDDLAKQIIDLGQTKAFTELQQLIAKCDIKLVCTVIVFFLSSSIIEKRFTDATANIFLCFFFPSLSEQLSNVSIAPMQVFYGITC